MSNGFETTWTCFDVTPKGKVARIRLNRAEAFKAKQEGREADFPDQIPIHRGL